MTIAAAEIVRLLFMTTAFDQVTGSADGLGGYHDELPRREPDPATARTASARGRTTRTTGGCASSASWRSRSRVVVVWRLMRSPWGRVLKGIREDEDAVRALGKNVFPYKMQALVLGGVIGALGGIVYALPSRGHLRRVRDVAHVLPLDGPAARRRGDDLRAASSAR